MQFVGHDWLEPRLGSSIVQVIDPRLRVRYTSGHIKGALHLPLAKAFGPDGRLLPEDRLVGWLRSSGVSTDSHVVVYDQGDGQSGAMLAWILEYLGHPEVHFLREGFEKWASGGREVFYRPVLAEQSGNFRSELRPELRASWREVLEATGINILDARSREEFDGKKTVGDDPPGHIPGATSLPWLDFIDGRSNMWVSAELANDVIQRACLPPDGPTIVYCRTGPRAALVTLLMRATGYSASLYDGSWADWTSRELPTELSAEDQ